VDPCLDEFHKRAKVAALLDHPHITRLYNHGTLKHGLTFVVMDYIEGRSLLDEIVRTGPLNRDRAIPIFAQIADALIYAHTQDIAHCSLMPSRVILTQSDHDDSFVKVGGFYNL